MFGRLWLAAMLVASGIGSAAAQDEAPQSPEDLRAAILDVLGASDVPGAQMAIIEDGDVTMTINYGVANQATGEPVTDNTVFRAGSISKSFIGIAAMMAVEDGLFLLEDYARALVPDAEFINPWEPTDPITLAHLMEHTAGFYDITLEEFLMSEPGISLADGIAVNPSTRLSRWRPGTYYSYANSGPAIAARAVEIARDQDFDTLLRESILRPIGMDVSDLLLTPEIEARLSQSYAPNLDDPIPYYHILMRPSGALNTTALELAQLPRLMIGRGEVDGVRLLSPESVERIERSETSESVRFYGFDQTYGLGNDTQYFESIVMRGHGGGIDGFASLYAYDADLRIGFTLMVNQGDFSTTSQVTRLITDYLLRNHMSNLPPPFERSEGDLAAYEGWYFQRYARSRAENAILAFATPLRASYSAGEGFVVAGVPRVPNGEHTMRTQSRAESSFALTLDSTYRQELRYGNSTIVKSSLLMTGLRLALSFGIVLGAVLAVTYELWRGAAWGIGRLMRRPTPAKVQSPRLLRPVTFIAGACLFAMGFVLVDVGSAHFTQLGAFASPTPIAVALFGFSIAAPLLAGVGLGLALIGDWNGGVFRRWYHIFANGLIVASMLWLSQWGWIGIRVWTF